MQAPLVPGKYVRIRMSATTVEVGQLISLEEKTAQVETRNGFTIQCRRGQIEPVMLVVCDLNGVLGSRRKKRDFLRRPDLDIFIPYLFKNFVVAVWSSCIKTNGEQIVSDVFGPHYGSQLLFSMFRDECTPAPTATNPYATIKDLNRIWQQYPQSFDQTNTIIIDDSDEKCSHRFNALCPTPFEEGEISEVSRIGLADLMEVLKKCATSNSLEALRPLMMRRAQMLREFEADRRVLKEAEQEDDILVKIREGEQQTPPTTASAVSATAASGGTTTTTTTTTSASSAVVPVVAPPAYEQEPQKQSQQEKGGRGNRNNKNNKAAATPGFLTLAGGSTIQVGANDNKTPPTTPPAASTTNETTGAGGSKYLKLGTPTSQNPTSSALPVPSPLSTSSSSSSSTGEMSVDMNRVLAMISQSMDQQQQSKNQSNKGGGNNSNRRRNNNKNSNNSNNSSSVPPEPPQENQQPQEQQKQNDEEEVTEYAPKRQQQHHHHHHRRSGGRGGNQKSNTQQH